LVANNQEIQKVFWKTCKFATSIRIGSKQSRDPNRILENLQICYFYPYR